NGRGRTILHSTFDIRHSSFLTLPMEAYDSRMNNEHHYNSHLTWDGNRGDGTSTYQSYGREWRIEMDGKPALHGSADAAFRGEAEKHNPEDLFLAAISSCHLLSYLALCAKYRVNVVAYEDRATGVMREDAR